MITITQQWVGYLDRSYEQVKRSCLQELTNRAPEISDHSESNPLIIFLSMFAGIAEMLNLYVDAMAREMYLGTCRRYSSAVKISKLIDYNIHAKNPATVNLWFALYDDTNAPTVMTGSPLVIPTGTIVNSANGALPFVLLQDVRILPGIQNAYGPAAQYVQITNAILGTTDGSALQRIELPDDFGDGSLSLIINGENWKWSRSGGLMFFDSKAFITNVDEQGTAFFQFGDGINGKIPGSGFTIYGTYRSTQGTLGNLPPGQINQLQGTFTTPPGVVLRVSNPDYSSGGEDFETLFEIKNRAPRSIRTLERAVTYQDYVDLCYLVLGVGAAEVSFCCGKFVDVYIAPTSPGVSTIALLQAVRDYLNCKIMLTTQVSVNPAGIAKIWIKGTIYGKPLISSSAIYNEVVDKLDVTYGYSTIQINKKVDILDIISTIKSCVTVGRFDIEQIKIKPFPRPVEGNLNPLNVDIIQLPITDILVKYQIIWRSGPGQFDLYKNGTFLNQQAVGAPYNDGIIGFTLQAGTYTNNDKWELWAYPSYPEIFPTTIINIKDFSCPIVEVGPLIDATIPRTIYSDLTIVTTSSTTSCLPPCD